MIVNVSGLIIKEYVIGESDKYITLFTKEIGKIQVGAPRAKKYDKGLASGTQLFVYGNFVLASYKDTYKLISVEIIHMFHHLREDLMTLSYATYFLEFISEVAEEGAGNEKLLSLTLRGLHTLRSDKPFKLIRRVFELRALCILGFMPELYRCTGCGRVLGEEEAPWPFVVGEGGLVCPKCRDFGLAYQLLPTTLYTLKYIAFVPIKEVYKFNLDEQILSQLSDICDLCVAYYIDKKFKTLDFIEGIETV
ncbi:MAG: DNA repair protein RecO [Cellulosilyticaceae bacterium]